MLDFQSLATEFGDLARETSRRQLVRESQLEIALRQARIPDDVWAAEHADRIRTAKTKWLTGRPMSASSFASQCASASIDAPEIYTAIAVDGSQIPLDRHEVVTCFVLNTGSIALHYGTGARPIMRSAAKLFYRDEDLYSRSSEDARDADGALITERDLAQRRFAAEMDALAALIDECAGRPNVVAFLDGPLILWTLEAESREPRNESLHKLLALLNLARNARIPIVGYVSLPGGREAVNALRVSLCPESNVVCAACPFTGEPSLPCGQIDRLRDADLFGRLLEPGRRSGLFTSDSKILQSYKPDENKIAFCYLNTGSEVARLEFPCWVAGDPAMIELVHAAALDQCLKGLGYPVSLTEAHQQAVVHAADRDAFFRLVQRELARSNLPAIRTAKAISKRRPIG